MDSWFFLNLKSRFDQFHSLWLKLSYLKWSINSFLNANIVGRLDFREVEYNQVFLANIWYISSRNVHNYSIHQYDLCIKWITVQQVDIWRQISRVHSRLLHLSLYFHNQVWRSGGKVYNYHRVHPQLHPPPGGLGQPFMSVNFLPGNFSTLQSTRLTKLNLSMARRGQWSVSMNDVIMTGMWRLRTVWHNSTET